MRTRGSKTIPLVQYILFAMLVVATPFVVVSRFLQGAVYNLSHMMWHPFGIELPIVGSLAVAMFALFILWQRKNITLRRIYGSLVIAGMILFAQWVQDLYSNMKIYDLQKNWHYIAYGAYVYMFFAAFHVRGVSKSKMILLSFFSAVALSSFDELFQFRLSSRIFDISDIAKDSWGAMMGLVSVLFVSETYGSIELRKRSFRWKRINSFLHEPVAAMMVTAVFSLVLILISPLLTEHEYLSECTLISLGIFLPVMTLLYLARFRPFRIGVLSVVGVLALLLAGSFILNIDRNITRASSNIIVYKGMPIPYFDLLIYPDGLPRLTDKKRHFNHQDQRFFMNCNPDILLIGSGYGGTGGKGFRIESGTTVIYNSQARSVMQVIIMKTPEACSTFNRLKREGKRVLFVVHNS